MNNNNELDFNREKRENYENLMQESSTKTDDYYDKKNPIVQIVLLVLGIIIIIGVIYYALMFASF